MKLAAQARQSTPLKAAFTLVEVMVASVAVGAVGLAIYTTLIMGTVLFQKNSAMNNSHEQARTALLQMEQDLHAAASYPSLIDTSYNLVSGTGPAAGVAFQAIVSGTNRCQVAANASASSTTVQIYTSSTCPAPYTGERLIIPTYSIEKDVTGVTTSGSSATLTLSGSLGTALVVSQSGSTYNIPCFLTQKVYYLVNSAGTATINNVSTPIYALNYYGIGRTRTYILAANSIGTQTPFCLSSNATTGTANNQSLVAINISIMNTTFNDSITQFNTANIVLNGQIPVYAKITDTTQ